MASAEAASSKPFGDSWLREWIEAQRQLIGRWQATPPAEPAAVGKEWDGWWRGVGERVNEPVRDAVDKLREAGNAYFAGLAQFTARAKSDSSTPGAEGATGPFASAAHWWAKAPAIGIARESVMLVQAVTEAQAECERLGSELNQVFASIQQDALDLLERRASERVHAAKPVRSYRELYDLWVECGEEIYARAARADSFTALQAKVSNAAMRLRAAEQRLAEQSLRYLDLPTRAELNSVHRRLQEMRAELERLRTPAAAAKKKAPKTAKRTPAKKKASSARRKRK
jgi:hypothetical protein